MQCIPFLHYLHFTHLFPFLSSSFKNSAKPLCSTYIGRQLSSPCPFLASTFAPTRRRLACYIHLHSVITSFRFIPQPHTPLHHFATLMVSFRFPNAGSRLFFLFNLWVLDWRLWTEQHFFSSCENDFLLVLWIHSPFFSKGHVSHQSSSHQIHSFLNAKRGVLPSCTFHSFSVSFVARGLQSAGYVFQSLAVVSWHP